MQEQIIPITGEWAIIVDHTGKPLQGVTLTKPHIRTVLDPLHIALIGRLTITSNRLAQLTQEIAS